MFNKRFVVDAKGERKEKGGLTLYGTATVISFHSSSDRICHLQIYTYVCA